MSQMGPHATLRRLFDAVLEEAANNPQFAARLAEAFGQEAGTNANRPRRPARKASPNGVPIHAVNMLRTHGEAALRGKLEQIKAVDDLKSVATASGLVLAGDAGKMRAGRAELITGIIEAAKHYDAQRTAATA